LFPLTFRDDGKEADQTANDGIVAAFLPLEKRGGTASIHLSMGERKLWSDTIPIAENRPKLRLKLLQETEHLVVKVDTFEIAASSPEKSTPSEAVSVKNTIPTSQNTERLTPNIGASFRWIGYLFLLGLGYGLGRRVKRTLPSLSISSSNLPLIQDALSSSKEQREETLLQLCEQYRCHRPVVLISSQHYNFTQKYSAGVFHHYSPYLSFLHLEELFESFAFSTQTLFIIDGFDSFQESESGGSSKELREDLFHSYPQYSLIVLELSDD